MSRCSYTQKQTSTNRSECLPMRLTLLFIVACILFGCVATRDNTNSNELFKTYLNAKAAFNQPYENTFYAQHVWHSLIQARQNGEKSEFASVLASYPNQIVNVIRTLSDANESTGCLLVGGNGSEGELLEHYVHFVKVGDNWLINDITVHYFLDGEQPYLQHAVCDQNKRQELWLQSTLDNV